MDVTNSCRDTNELNKIVKTMLEVALEKAKKKGVNPLITETYRSKERQYYLYGQGRTVSQCTLAGMPLDKAKAYARSGNQVTWTLNSQHISRLAVDVIPQRNGVAIWNSNDEDTKQLIKCMESVGFEAGANWKSSPDSPHFQVLGISGKVLSSKNTNYYLTKAIQKKLNKAGFYNTTIDGDWGKATDKAIKEWRKSIGYRKLAILGLKALSKLLKY